ncbi:MAG: hypothetical protein HQ518_05385 [Rhodopirellula sp.]|nr:hypothetical protein [Rhodopirellula sp.]
MAIEFNCPTCGAAIRVPDAAAGAKGSCPTCHTKLLVPQVAAPPQQPPSQQPPAVQQANPPMVISPQPIDPASTPYAPAPQSPFTELTSAAPGAVPISEPMIPQFGTPPPVQFSGPPTVPAGGLPIVPGHASVAARVRRRSKGKKSGLWFPVLCGLGLVAGMAWLYLQQQPDVNGDRVAAFIKDEALKPKTVDMSLVDVPDRVKKNVLNHFSENRERLKSQLVETQFTANDAGLEVQILTGSKTRFVRFTIDKDLRTWYDENLDQLESSHRGELKKALKDFFTDWDVAARNQQGVEDFAVYRDSVGLASSVEGLGFNVCARIDQTLYPCVYEDEGFLYFLLPSSTRTFKIVGARVDGKKSYFPGEYDVTIKTAKM